MIQLRDYQEAARQKILATWGERPWYREGETFKSCLLNIPTSAGKTIVAGAVCQAVSGRGRFLYLADRDELCEQPLKRFYRQLGINAALDKAETKASRHAHVVVASIQTLQRQTRLERYDRNHFQYIFVDEAHRSVDQAMRIREYFSSAKVCGQTATAFRAKLKDLSSFYDTVAYEVGLFDLIGDGYVVPIKVLTLPVEVDICDVKQSQSFGEQDYDKEGLDSKITPFYNRICELIREHAPVRQIVAFLPLIKSSMEFVRIAQQHGISAKHIDHESPDRRQLLEAFEQKRFQLISCSTLLSTGWDCPPCDCLLNLTPTRLPGTWRQKVGRIVRVLPGVIDGISLVGERIRRIAQSAKPDALILDLLYHTERFGLQGAADLIAANDSEKTAITEALKEADEEIDLLEVVRSLQAAKEAALKKELEAAAKRKADGLIDAMLYASILHDRDLETYEAVSNWQTEKITEKQANLLAKFGVDPATARDRGHANALLTTILGRKQLGLANHRTVQALEAKGVPSAKHYSDVQAYKFLRDDYPFPFGLPAKRKWTFKQVPASYWRWLTTQDWVEKSWPIVWRRMQEIGVVNPAFSLKGEG